MFYRDAQGKNRIQRDIPVRGPPAHNTLSQRPAFFERLFDTRAQQDIILAKRIARDGALSFSDAMAIAKAGNAFLEKAQKLDKGDYNPRNGFSLASFRFMRKTYRLAMRKFRETAEALEELGMNGIAGLYRQKVFGINEKLELINEASIKPEDVRGWEL